MTLNIHMHSRNMYKGIPPDFLELSRLYPKFEPYVRCNTKGKAYVDFRNPASVRELAICLLHKDFGYTVALPNDRLSPTIPSRLNYVLWVEDLLNSIITKRSYEEFKVIDIGTGCACVYPLLGTHVNPRMVFTATEIDETNYQFAKKNVEANDMQHRIKVCKVDATVTTLLTHLFKDDIEKYDCCICNPPFFKDYEDAFHQKRGLANSSCHASDVEAIVEGGDLEFAERIYKESLILRDKLTWYTIMFGKKSSFKSFKRELMSDEKSTVMTEYEFCQGNTIRWGFAWSFSHCIDGSKLPSSPFRISSKEKRLSKPISFYIHSPSIEASKERLLAIFNELSISFKLISSDAERVTISAVVFQNTWVGARRRARKRKYSDVPNPTITIESRSESVDPVLVFQTDLTKNVGNSRTLALLKAEDHTQKELLNSLVVHIKRLLLKQFESNKQ